MENVKIYTLDEVKDKQESYAFDRSPLLQGYGIGSIAERLGVEEFPTVNDLYIMFSILRT